jgi:hypothetical protein
MKPPRWLLRQIIILSFSSYFESNIIQKRAGALVSNNCKNGRSTRFTPLYES